jgi:hypothetical protein
MEVYLHLKQAVIVAYQYRKKKTLRERILNLDPFLTSAPDGDE